MPERKKIALVVGAGRGLGAALARRFARAGAATAVAARGPEPLQRLAGEIGARAYPCDATREGEVVRLFERIGDELGDPDLVVYNAGSYRPGTVLETGAEEFEQAWRIGCLGGFLVGREAARRMAARGSGTVLFTGATAALRGSAGFVNLAVGKFGLRALAQSMARELGPRGIHVAHVVIDGQIEAEHRPGRRRADRGADALLDPDAIAETFWQLHLQPRSAWTLELDLRPWVEKF